MHGYTCHCPSCHDLMAQITPDNPRAPEALALLRRTHKRARDPDAPLPALAVYRAYGPRDPAFTVHPGGFIEIHPPPSKNTP